MKTWIWEFGGEWENEKMASVCSLEFWRCRPTFIALIIIFILLFHLSKKFSSKFLPISTSSSSSSSPSSSLSDSQSRIPEIVSDSDLKFLIDNLDEKLNEDERWENVIDKKNNFLSYNTKCCRPKDRTLKYLSTTVFESCSPELLRDFYMDNGYRKRWDKTILDHVQLQMDTTKGIEIGRTIKKFPLLTPREYILAWRLWEGKDRTFYCVIKHHDRRSMFEWYILDLVGESGKAIPGRDASEIRMFHQEDAGLNVEMAKLAFAKGIWSYVCKMDNALRQYSVISHPLTSPTVYAATLIHQDSPELDTVSAITSPAVSASVVIREPVNGEAREKKLSRRPSKMFIAKSLLLLGGVICLSRGHSFLGAKVTMAYILTKLRKSGDSSS